MRCEDWVGSTFQAGQEVRAKVIHGAYEVFVAHEEVGHEEAENDGADPGAHESLYRLLGRQLDELGTPEGDTADVSKDVVGYDERDWQEKPDHAFEDVVHDKVGLHDDQVESHMRPGELCELKAVVAFLKRHDKEDKTCTQPVSKLDCSVTRRSGVSPMV